MGPMIVNIDSTELSNQECALLENELIGGVLLFDHNYVDKIQVNDLIKSIKNINDKLVIAIDQEGGRVQRFKNGFTLLPSFSEIGHSYLTDPDLADKIAYSSGYVCGYELKEIGIDVNFSPVIDLSFKSNVLNKRTLSSDPAIVIRLASMYIKGLIDNGITPTLKHFPGHGCVSSDTHLNVSKCEISYNDLMPHISTFKELHNQFMVPIMTSHIIFTEISDSPVTTSNQWLGKLSKDIYKTEPFFISDDLEMAAITDKYSNQSRIDILNKSLESGCNMAIVTTMQNKSIINNNMSYDFYNSEYISKNHDILIPKLDKDLLCPNNIIYNEGVTSVYQDAVKCLESI